MTFPSRTVSLSQLPLTARYLFLDDYDDDSEDNVKYLKLCEHFLVMGSLFSGQSKQRIFAVSVIMSCQTLNLS